MIRGINRKIIEINDTQNKYFEKAILFLSNTAPEPGDHELKNEVDFYLMNLGSPPSGARRRISKKKKRIRRAVFGMICAALGAGLSLIVQTAL